MNNKYVKIACLHMHPASQQANRNAQPMLILLANNFLESYLCIQLTHFINRFNIIQVMYLSTEYKADIFARHGKGATDTGSAEGQVALFTSRIAHLTGHLKKNKKDFSTQLSLQKLVGKRRALLAYLYKKDINRYRAIIKALELRDIIK